MNIIFGDTVAKEMGEKYTVLELDQMRIQQAGPVLNAYCVIEKDQLPVDEISQITNHINLHTKLMENYRKKNWSFCEQALEHLHGKWGGTLNSFYDEISGRIAKYKVEDPGPDWNGVYEKFVSDC